jgi:uncharacterized protein (DUF1778 family)
MVAKQKNIPKRDTGVRKAAGKKIARQSTTGRFLESGDAVKPPKSASIAAARIAKRDTLNVRIKAEDRGLIERAASSVGKTRTDFVLDAVRRAAEDALLDRTLIRMTPANFANFQAALDDPSPPNAKLRSALQRPAPWEK